MHWTTQEVTSRVRLGSAPATFLAGLLLTLAATSAVITAAYTGFLLRPLAWAWGVSAAHGFLFAFFNAKAVGPDLNTFLRWGLVMNVTRVVALLAVIFLAGQSGMEHFDAFVVATLVGYFCFLFSEIAHLAAKNMQGNSN